MELTPANKDAIVHAFDVDDTLTMKPDGFDNTGLTKDQFFGLDQYIAERVFVS